MYLVRTPNFIQRLFGSYIWRKDDQSKSVYLTFDDGPIPEVTPWVLEQLAKYNAKATFFCVGENALRHPNVLKQVKQQGHSLGNHTHNHLSGWSTELLPYINNIRKCSEVVESKLFRPPYGRIRPSQAEYLRRHFQIVMWDVLSGDFDDQISPEQCLANVLTNVVPGSIVVFHDSLKSEKNLKYVLPKVLSELHAQGYSFEAVQEPSSYGQLAATA